MAGDKYQDGNKPAYRKGGRQKKEGLSNFVFGKVQPQAVPLEEAVLGAIMLDKEALTVVLDILRAESFYLDAHQLIYKAMMRLFEKSQPVDLLTVTEELKKTEDLEAAGGPYYLIELTNKVASAAIPRPYHCSEIRAAGAHHGVHQNHHRRLRGLYGCF